MKRIITFTILIALLFLIGCEVNAPQQAQLNMLKQQLILRKIAALGNSITMGIQSAGIKKDFQMNNYPYFIAQQLGMADEFQQPYVADPGIGQDGHTPLYLNANGEIVSDPLTVDPMTLLLNAYLPRPYDNMSVSGATLYDVLHTTATANATDPTNLMYDMVLRNPTFGNMTALQQTMLLNPSLILLWIGNNPILGAALHGTDDSQYFVPQDQFKNDYTELLTTLRTNLPNTAIVMANIPNVTDIPYVNSLDDIIVPSPGLGINDPVPVVFQSAPDSVTGGIKLIPVDFGGGLYLPLLTAEQGVAHVLLPTLDVYQTQGLGVPDSAALVGMGLAPDMASQLVAGMVASGLIPSGVPLPDYLTLTADETAAIKNAIDGFNATLATLAGTFQVPMVDANTLLNTINISGISGVTGKFALMDPGHTGFSLDGVHPNNAGHAVLANEFIKQINANFGLTIPSVDVTSKMGQYVPTGKFSSKGIARALEQVKAFYPPISR